MKSADKAFPTEKGSLDELLFFEGKPKPFLIYETLRKALVQAHADVSINVKKTQISFRNRYVFALVSFQRVPHAPKESLLITFGLPEKKDSPRIAVATQAARNRWTHHVVVQREEEINEELLGWIEDAYAFSLRK